MDSMHTVVSQVTSTAKTEVGYLEKVSNSHLDDKTANAGHGNWTKYARDLDELGAYNGKKNGFSWCDTFADWCFVTAYGFDTAMKMTFQPKGGYGAGCTASSNYYKAAGRFYEKNPQVGDQIFFKNAKGVVCHTGIVTKVDDTRVYTIEGNTSSSSGVVANGGAVREKSYLLSHKLIYGYGRPDYSLVQEDEDMDAIRFSELFAEMRKEMQDNDCSSYSEEARAWAVSNGLIVGNGVTDDGDPNYMWKDFLSREQMMTILHRFAKLMGKA